MTLATGPLCTSHDMNCRRNTNGLHASSPSDIYNSPPFLARPLRPQSRRASLRIQRNFLSLRKAKQKIHRSSASYLPRICSMRTLQVPTTIPNTTSPTPPPLIIHGFGNIIPSIDLLRTIALAVEIAFDYISQDAIIACESAV